MKIAVLVEFFPPRLGSDRRIFEIMRRLTSQHEIHFIVIPPLRLFYGTIKPTGTVSRHLWKNESSLCYEKIHGSFIPISSKLFNLWGGKIGSVVYLLTITHLFFKVLKVMKRINPNVIVINHPSANTGILGLVTSKIFRRKVVTDFCDLIAEYTCFLLKIRGVKAKALSFIQKFIVTKSNIIITPTEAIRRHTKDLGIHSNSIHVIPNGVDTTFFDPANHNKDVVRDTLQLPLEQDLCLYCGRMDEWAGKNILQQIANRLEDHDVKVVIVGDGEATLHSKNIFSWGVISHMDVPSFLASADVVLVPFPDEDFAHAASPLKLFEAMAMACPIVASRIEGIEEIITNNNGGILVDPENTEEWCQAVMRLIRNPLLSKRLGQHAREVTLKHYDWNLLADQYEKMVSKTVYAVE